jgi:hypothetical protein
MACQQLQISVVAYEAIKGKVFVRVPNERGRWMLTDRCVAEVPCEWCGSVTGEPCSTRRKRDPLFRYGVATHIARRMAADRKRGWRSVSGPPPKLRIRIEDITAAEENPDG